MSAISTYRRKIYSGKRQQTKRVWMTVVLVLAMALAAIAVVAAQAQASSFSDWPPKTVLRKGSEVHQEGWLGSSTWHAYHNGSWSTTNLDGGYGFPRAAVARAGSRLHIRLNKPQRPESFTIKAYPRVDEYGRPAGELKRLNTTFGRAERDGKTVAWNVFFRVNEPNSHYYLVARGNWKRVPGTHFSYGSGIWFFHVKTTD